MKLLALVFALLMALPSVALGQSTDGPLRILIVGAYPDKELRKYCPANLVQTADKNNAEYVMAFQNMTNHSLVNGTTFDVPFTGVKVSKQNGGDIIHSGVTRSFSNAVKDACNAIKRDIAKK